MTITSDANEVFRDREGGLRWNPPKYGIRALFASIDTLKANLSGATFTGDIDAPQVFAGPKTGWTGYPFPNSVGFSALQGVATDGNFGVIGASRASDQGGNPGAQSTIGLAGLVLNDTYGANADTAYGIYSEPRRAAPSGGDQAGTIHGAEINPVNEGDTISVTPYAYNQMGSTEGVRVTSGRPDIAGSTDMSVGYILSGNGAQFLRGIVVTDNALDASVNEWAAVPVGAKLAGHRSGTGETQIYHDTNGAVHVLGRNTGNTLIGIIVAPAGGNGVVPSVNDALASGAVGARWERVVSNKFMFDSSNGLFAGSGSPEGVLAANVGSIYERTDGVPGGSFYVKETGTGNTGWTAVGSLLRPNTLGTYVGIEIAPGGVNGVLPSVNDALGLGATGTRWERVVASKFMFDNNNGIFAGAGSPEGVVAANVGSLYQRADGGAGSSLYVKESGFGNTGWVAK